MPTLSIFLCLSGALLLPLAVSESIPAHCFLGTRCKETSQGPGCFRQRCPKETIPGRMEQRCGLRHRALCTCILDFKIAHWMGHSEDQTLRKEQRCFAEKRNTKSVSKGSSDGTLYSMAVPGFSLHSEEQNDSTIAMGVHCQGSVPEPDPPTLVTSSSFQMWDGVLGVMLGVTMKALCHHSWCFSRSPHSSSYCSGPHAPLSYPSCCFTALNLEA